MDSFDMLNAIVTPLLDLFMLFQFCMFVMHKMIVPIAGKIVVYLES